MTFTIPASIFLLFFAVLYGALFTISDKWRPVLGVFGLKHGMRRFLVSVLHYGVLPVLYFLWAFPRLLRLEDAAWHSLLLAIYSVAPLLYFHLSWMWFVLPRPVRSSFYSEAEHGDLRPLFTWMDRMPVNRRHVVLSALVLLYGPILPLSLL